MGNTTGPLYVEKLVESRIIDKDMFSFYFTEAGNLSWVDLGTPDYENVRSGSEIHDVQLIEEDFFYADYCQGVAIGDLSSENTMVWESSDLYNGE